LLERIPLFLVTSVIRLLGQGQVRNLWLIWVLVCALAVTATTAQARRIALIRDAEVEHTIGTYAAPLFTAAGLDASAVRVLIVKDRGLNAFVAGGQKIFVNTGLLLAAGSPQQLIGVLAHETGHISGGHLARTQEALKNASVPAIIGMVLGAAAMVSGAPGGAQAAPAILLGGQHMAGRTFLKYSRTQESAADQAAVALLAESGRSPQGLLDFLDILGEQELLSRQSQDPYAQSHPLNRQRIELLRRRAETSKYRDAKPSAAEIEAFQRLQAKLRGFIESPARVFKRYPASDRSVAAHYARAAAHHNDSQLQKALVEIEHLLAERPDDAFFQELKGQILYEHGRVKESLAPYQAAVRLRPELALLRVGLAQSQIASQDASLLATAIGHLETAARQDSNLVGIWRQLAVAYGREGRFGLSALASAEFAFRLGRAVEALLQAERAAKKLPQNSPGWLRAQDIISAIKVARESRRGGKRKR
jgi:predicted Zn-dependent protease